MTSSCDGDQGGEHSSKLKYVPVDGGVPLLLDLVQKPGGDPRVRLTCGDQECRMPLRSGRTLSHILRDLANVGRKAES